MFYDWLKVTQQFDTDLPLVSDRAYQNIVVESGELGHVCQPRFQHKGSFSTAINVQISGSRLTMDGNPSKFNRLDNVVGLSTLDQCFSVYNTICDHLGLPRFTKCTKTFYRQGEDGSKAQLMSDGAVIQRLDITSNLSTGGFSKDYLRGLSSIRYRNSIPRLHTNGFGVDWLSKQGNARLMYNKVYDKANELQLRAMPSAKRTYGAQSVEYLYLLRLHKFLIEQGVTRFEQELHSEYLQRNNFRFYGLFDECELRPIHEDFLRLDDALCLTELNIMSIAEKLLEKDICTSSKAANTTANYAYMWMHGRKFDSSKSQVKVHRARLRKVGIDIFDEYDSHKFSPVFVERGQRIDVTPMSVPDWYQRPLVQPQLRVA